MPTDNPPPYILHRDSLFYLSINLYEDIYRVFRAVQLPY
jgi:hypothetical protein